MEELDQLAEAISLLDNLDHLRNIRKLQFYKPYKYQVEFHNAKGKGTNEPAKQRLLLAANKIGKCTSIGTKIDTGDGRKKMSEIWGKPCYVLTYPNKTPKKVMAWVKKPPEECFRIEMKDGQWVEIASGHLLLCADGLYRPLSEILLFLPESVVHAQGFVKGGRISARRLF